MAELHTDDNFMYHNCRDAKQASWENQLLDDYDTVSRDYRDSHLDKTAQTDPLVYRITHQRGPKVPARVDLTKPLSQQIGGDHYRQGSIQPIEYIHANNMDFFSGNVCKYITRWKYKNGLEDLKKAKHYIELLMEQEYGYHG